ncbi:MAG: hypothetical protein NXH89_17595 [Cyclobacteriaceae bacterium]|nr:hypothetical protein [Cyclobacteriaceae bacterium]
MSIPAEESGSDQSLIGLGIDIALIPKKKRFMYLTAITGLYSRHIVGWPILNNIEAEWYNDVLEEVISYY